MNPDEISVSGEIIFIAFRLLSAIVLTGVAGYVTVKLWRGALKPVPVWLYAAVVLWLVTAYRWFIVWLVTVQDADYYPIFVAWLQPITQTMYVLLAMVVFVLAFTHIKARRRHYDEYHDAGLLLPSDPADE